MRGENKARRERVLCFGLQLHREEGKAVASDLKKGEGNHSGD